MAGTVIRVAANDVETAITKATREHLAIASHIQDSEVLNRLERAVIKTTRLTITVRDGDGDVATCNTPWQAPAKDTIAPAEFTTPFVDQKLLQAVIRAHAWVRQLDNGGVKDIEDLAGKADYHPKVVRQNLRLAYLAPDITAKILAGEPLPFTLRSIPKLLPLDCERNIL